MQISLLKSKIHRAVVTDANLNYEGSLSVSAELAEAVGLEEYERILVGNMGNGERFETYLIYGPRGKGVVQLGLGGCDRIREQHAGMGLAGGIHEVDASECRPQGSHHLYWLRFCLGRPLPSGS